MSTHDGATIRVLTYNVLLGGGHREQRIAQVLRRSEADVIALQEVRDDGLLQRLAASLRMTSVFAPPGDGAGLGLGVLARVPVDGHRNHRHAEMLRSHLELTLAIPGLPLRLHVLHLAARFGERAQGEERRVRELGCVLRDIERASPAPHLVLGDFNSLAPGEHLEATRFFRRMGALRRAGLLVRRADGWMAPVSGGGVAGRWLAHGIDPDLLPGVPALPRLVGHLTALLPESRQVDRVLGRMIERRAVPLILGRGYADCYRRLHPRAHGYTCATWLPAARIDYVFASPEMARRLIWCDVIGGRGRPDREAPTASDHFPVAADFRL
ncbi:MAG: endonuclease/exonuclease/phosphatase family protein [Candidatus Dormibacteria bacterium]|jgi:endonuclease/exonuclease/phosphatase family metal-dependent hydrolase